MLRSGIFSIPCIIIIYWMNTVDSLIILIRKNGISQNLHPALLFIHSGKLTAALQKEGKNPSFREYYSPPQYFCYFKRWLISQEGRNLQIPMQSCLVSSWKLHCCLTRLYSQFPMYRKETVLQNTQYFSLCCQRAQTPSRTVILLHFLKPQPFKKNHLADIGNEFSLSSCTWILRTEIICIYSETLFVLGIKSWSHVQ